MMRLVKKSLLASALFCGAFSSANAAPPLPTPARSAQAASSPSADSSLAALLPPGRMEAELMQPEPSQHLAALSRKMQEGIKKNSQWFMAEIQKVKMGEHIPYDARLNLTPEEYNELSYPMAQVQLRKIGSGPLLIKGAGNRLQLSGQKRLAGLLGIEVDLQQHLVKTPYGVLKAMTVVKANSEQPASAQWNGFTWKLNTLRPNVSLRQQNGTKLEFSIGKLVKSGRIQLLYSAQQVNAGRLKVSIGYLLHYDPPAKPVRKR